MRMLLFMYPRRLILALALAVLVTALRTSAGAGAAAAALAEPSREYQLKAAYIYNFIQFIEWPKEKAAAAADDREPIVIATVGADPFNGALAHAAACHM